MTDASIATAPYRITPALMREAARLRPSPRGLATAYYAALALMVVAIIAVHELFSDAPVLQLTGFVAVAFALIVIALVYRRAVYAWHLRRTPALESEIVIRIDESGVRIKNKLMEGWLAWRAVVLVRETKSAIFIFTQPAAAYSVPRSAFPDAAAAAQFAAAVHAHWRAARGPGS